MTQQPRLYVLQGQRLSEQRVGFEVQHAEAQIEARPPVRVDPAQLIATKWRPFDRRTGGAIRRYGLLGGKCLVGSERSAHRPVFLV
jgi:hypothetical protein